MNKKPQLSLDLQDRYIKDWHSRCGIQEMESGYKRGDNYIIIAPQIKSSQSQ